MSTETYLNNFVSQDCEIVLEVLTKIAEKIYTRMKEENRKFLWTDRKPVKGITHDSDTIYDTLYGYVYDANSCDIYERSVKGFAINDNGLFICMDLDNVSYPEKILEQTFNDPNEECWYLLYDNKSGSLRSSDEMNTCLTMLSISECIYQYFD